MAIINNANPGSHIPTLLLIDELLNAAKAKKNDAVTSASKILNATMPEALYLNPNAKKKMKESLAFWGGYRLWDVSELSNEKGYSSVSLFSNYSNLPKRILDLISNEYVQDGELLVPLERYFNDDKLSKDFSIFILAMCFFLYQEEYTFKSNMPFTQKSAYEFMLSSVLPDANRITYNNEESKGVINYGQMLGFIEPVGNDDYIPDPTRFIQWYLEDIFKGCNELTIQEFLNKLNQVLPIFDTGAYQKELPQYLNTKRPELITFNGDIRLSSSMSLALYRLESMNMLYLEARSDSRERFELTLPGSTVKHATNIKFIGTKQK